MAFILKSKASGGLAQVRALLQEYKENGAIMTPYEAQGWAAELARVRESASHEVMQSAFTAWQAAIARTKSALADIEKAKAAEIRRWDAGKLGAELANVQALVTLAQGATRDTFGGGASVSERLQAIYQEARTSGDIYKQRAAAEVLATQPINSANGAIAKQAARDLEALRLTPEMTQAQENAQAALQALQAQRAELQATGRDMGELQSPLGGGAYDRQLRLVQISADGRVTFHDADSPEVIGFDAGRLKLQADDTPG